MPIRQRRPGGMDIDHGTLFVHATLQPLECDKMVVAVGGAYYFCCRPMHRPTS